MLADAARRTADVDIDTIVSRESLRRAGFQAAAAALVLGVLLFASRGPARQALDAASLTLFPERVALERDAGQREGQGGHRRSRSGAAGRQPRADHRPGADRGRRSLARDGDDGDCSRLVPAGACRRSPRRSSTGSRPAPSTSPTYEIAVAVRRASRASTSTTPIPPGCGSRRAPRPTAATSTRRPAPTSACTCSPIVRRRRRRWRSAAASRSHSAATAPNELSAALTVSRRQLLSRAPRRPRRLRARRATPSISSASSRIAPPDVRVLKPATDRSVTRLEEVDIEAQAEDDYGVDRLDLVYSVRGGAEKVVPLNIPRANSTSPAVTRCSSRISTCSRETSSPTTCARATSRAARGQRSAQRHLLPRGQAVRAGVCARAEPGRHGRRRQPELASTISSSRKKRSSLPPGSSSGAHAAKGSEVRAGHQSGGAGRSGAEDQSRGDVELVP